MKSNLTEKLLSICGSADKKCIDNYNIFCYIDIMNLIKNKNKNKNGKK
jgi:hypothetical protein